jgi:cell division protein FtsQ
MSEFAMGDRFYAVQDEPRGRTKPASWSGKVDWSSTQAGRKPSQGGTTRAGAARGYQVHEGQKAARRKGARAGIERSLAFLLAALGAAILAAAAFVILPGALRVTRYSVSGATTMGEAEVLGAALVHGNEYFFSLDTEAMRASLLREPRIAAASVSKVFPNGLRIAVTERRPAAIVLVEGDGKLVPACLDETGMAFAWAADVLKDGAGDLPILSGIRFENFRLGTRLPAEFAPALASIGQVARTAPALLAAFSEIKLVKPAWGEPELLLYSLHHRVPVRTGAVLNESTLRSIILVLDVLGSRGLADGVKEIDFRTGTVVYRVKEGQPG